MSAKLDWSHYEELLKFNDINAINYYIDLTIKQNLSVRKLRNRIKNKKFEKRRYRTNLLLYEIYR